MLFNIRSLSSLFLLLAASFATKDVRTQTSQVAALIQRLSGHGREAGYWFSEFQDVLATMQSTYWNGTYWPTTIQWIGAFLDTVLAASDRSFTNALIEYNGTVPGSNTTAATIRGEILQYFSDIEAYYGDEDTVQIFGAAYDDAQWVVLEWLEAIKCIKQYDAYGSYDLGRKDTPGFAHRAHIFYNIVQDKFDTSSCGGGLTWNPALAPYKNAITNELFVSSSIAMYLYFPGDNNTDPYPSPGYTGASNKTLPALPPLTRHDPLLLENAVKGYDWFKTHNFTNAQGLIVDGFHISPNQTTCDERNEMIYTYNQGVVLSGLRQLWEATGDTTYLDDGYALVDTVINATGWYATSASAWAGLGRNGVMEDYCDAKATCSQDNQIFKGVYFHHLDLFCEPLPTRKALVPGLTHVADVGLAVEHKEKCHSYTPWIVHNAYAALSTRNASGIIGGWWGASLLNQTQAPSLLWAIPDPHHSVDVCNEPWVLHEPPWCHTGHGCLTSGNSSTVDGERRRAIGRSFDTWNRRRDSNDQGRGRTVETQGSGLGVVQAALDFMLRRSR